MSIDTLAEEYYKFLLGSGSKGRTPVTYKRKIEVFIQFLVEELGVKEVNCKNMLASLSIDQIIESIYFYIIKNEIKYKSTADGFFFALTSFYKYLLLKYQINNDSFHKTEDNIKLQEKYNVLVKERGLKTKEQTQAISEEECNNLIRICNECIEKPSKELLLKRGRYGSRSYNSSYLYFVSAVATKLLLLTGSKNSVLNNLKVTDYDEKLNKISINSFWIHLPDNLSAQMKKYIFIREKIIEQDEKVDQLFIGFNRKNRVLTNASLFIILKDTIGSQKAVAVAKYSILQMMYQNVPSEIIKAFTGFSDDVCDACREEIDIYRGKSKHERNNRLLDSKLRAIDTFDQL